jgi:hypothetical protein
MHEEAMEFFGVVLMEHATVRELVLDCYHHAGSGSCRYAHA